MPQFPENGWDAVDNHNAEPHHNFHEFMQGVQVGNEEQNHLIQEEVIPQESMVINPSDSSDDSEESVNRNAPNGLELALLGNEHQQENVLHVGMVQVMGPVLPPEMQWFRLFEKMMPQLLSKEVPLSLKTVSFCWVKRPWEEAFAGVVTWNELPDRAISAVPMRRIVTPKRNVARALNFDDQMASDEGSSIVFAADSGVAKKKRQRKVSAPLVQSTSRRFTRSCLKLDGYRPKPILDSQPKTKKRCRAKQLVKELEKDHVQGTDDNGDSSADIGLGKEQDFEAESVPETPLRVMQHVGIALGISPDKLTKEQLDADPKISKKNKSNDD
jgi:hypothetical protein